MFDDENAFANGEGSKKDGWNGGGLLGGGEVAVVRREKGSRWCLEGHCGGKVCVEV